MNYFITVNVIKSLLTQEPYLKEKGKKILRLLDPQLFPSCCYFCEKNRVTVNKL